MNKPTKKEFFFVQLMLGISLLLGVLPPLIMFLVSRKKHRYYREASRKALNFHLTIFPLFVTSSFLPSWYKYAFLAIETLIILYAMIRIAFQKPYHYPAIPYIKNKETKYKKKGYSHVQ
ncbi:DUF4870 domain-containing protein [Paenibacillus profundus]|uniref:DUF4870 domain-containing protein n=1 Tax=Paenibacillus profundus TaxID=1173085 RepID=A0ABS8YPX5_9BACL|nr:DUF4870 domain-containing protein [Paenibacillus profundus]MCE5173014.1 DUF4870 domain-containing protein [Paenibacillus profundus]